MDKAIEEARRNPRNVRFPELRKLCDHYFGEPRQETFAQPSLPHSLAVIPAHPRRHSREGGNPRGAGPQVGASCSAFTTSLSTGSYGMAKPYQVRQVLDAIAKMEGMQK